ncbi:MAG: tetratricopeptide repeat protein [Calditrichales bacterium]|nr:MAG: tetratricopeptide repeat protein [Calditrichales bacterium]
MRYLNFGLITILAVIYFSCGGTSKSTTDTGDLMVVDGEVSERIADLIENIEDEPNNLGWRLQLAREYEALDKNMEALKTYEGALMIDPNHSEIKYNYAELSLRMGEKRKALQAYKEILLGMDGPQYLARISPKFLDAYDVREVVATPDDEAFGSYSSDGTKIVYQAHNGTDWNIFEYDIATQTKRQITFDSADEENPALSPDMNILLFTSTKDDHRDVDYNQKLRDIYVMDLVTQRVTNLTTNSSNDWKPRFSRDGNFIVFVSERNDLRDVSLDQLFSNIFIMERSGSFQLRVTDAKANDGGPVIKGGEHGTIYFDSNREGTFDIYKMKADGKEISHITYNKNYNNVAPDLSSDDTKIAFFSDRDGNFEIYVMSEAGQDELRITSNPADDLNPVFSPDGKKILFHSNRSGNFDLFEVSLEAKTSGGTVSDVVARIDAALSTM